MTDDKYAKLLLLDKTCEHCQSCHWARAGGEWIYFCKDYKIYDLEICDNFKEREENEN
jgi:hypothetical protein